MSEAEPTNPKAEEAPGSAPPGIVIEKKPFDGEVYDVMGGSGRWEVKVHDHGLVALLDVMPRFAPVGKTADFAIVQAARVSYGQGTKQVNEDRGLIRYLARHRHTTPFEMVEFKLHHVMPIFVARQWIRHRTACLAGDSVLSFDLPGAGKRGGRQHEKRTIEEIHRLWHEGSMPIVIGRERVREMNLRMCEEGTGEIAHTRITDVWQSGVKPVFRVTLENGYSIKMTRDHRCLTERGWQTLGAATNLRLGAANGVTWDAGAPAFAVNGEALHRSLQWLEERHPTPLSRPADKPLPTPTRLMRTWSRIARIEYAGEEMTYDLEVKGPYHNFVANGFIVHNSVNEYSGRYSVVRDRYYRPTPQNVRQQSAGNRQGGEKPVDDMTARQFVEWLDEVEAQHKKYDDFVAKGVARELARVALPVSVYTEWYWKIDLHNLFHFLSLRMDEHAQQEIRDYADAMFALVRPIVPVAAEAFLDYNLKSLHLSRLEAEALRTGKPLASENKRENAEWDEKRKKLGL